MPLGEKVWSYYEAHSWFQRLVKYACSTTAVFWVVKGPMIWMLTDLLGVWYVFSAFTVGLFVTVICFMLSEFWIWTKRQRE